MNAPQVIEKRGACPGWNPDGSFDPDRCWADRLDGDGHEPETVCGCTTVCGDPGESGCCACNHSDVYLPCPVVGYGCGMGATGPRTCDCCTDEQWAAGAVRTS